MGNLRQLFNAKGMPFHEMLVNEYGGVAKIHGFFGDQQLYVSDPRALHSIIVKDQDAFDETSVFIETNKVIFGPGLVATTGQQHKRQRKIVIPVFSVPHLKRLTPIFYSVAERLADVIDSESDKNSGSIIDMADWMARVALETVGQTILGYSFDPLDSPHNNRYTSAIKELIPTLFKLSLVRQFAPFLSQLGSPSFRRKLVDLTPVSSVQAVKNMSDVMYATAKELLRQKQNEVSLGIVQDERSIIGALLKANEKASAEDKMTEDELIGQITVLIFGAQDTTASSLTRLLHMLSTHTNVQDQLRDEISEALASTGDGRLDYDVVMSLPLLDAVLKETLRLHPPVPFVRRTTLKDQAVPLANTNNLPPHIRDAGAVTVPAGTILFASIAGANRLQSVWGSDAKEWKPERWLNGDKNAAPGIEKLPGIYSGMLSFLGGERACVGWKFAQIEIKILIVTLISRFRFSATKEQGEVVWNLSQILSPSIRSLDGQERKGLPLVVERL
jgi:cytochrome P450